VIARIVARHYADHGGQPHTQVIVARAPHAVAGATDPPFSGDLVFRRHIADFVAVHLGLRSDQSFVGIRSCELAP